MEQNQLLGFQGEEQARQFLERKGYGFIARNFRSRYGEIDLVMRDRTTVVFVEVKRRQNDHYGEPEEAVNAAKQKHLIKAAFFYIQTVLRKECPVRFDVVSIGPLGIKHYENAFSTGDAYYY